MKNIGGNIDQDTYSKALAALQLSKRTKCAEGSSLYIFFCFIYLDLVPSYNANIKRISSWSSLT